MRILKLSDRNWNNFSLTEIFVIKPGKRLTKSDMHDGPIPFIGATDSNNGITAWVDNTNGSLDHNVIGVNYNGSVGEAFYHPYECIFSDDVKRLHLIDKPNESSYVMLFVKTMIKQQKIKFTYGYKFNGNRMERQKILLPVNHEGMPDWQFMEDYMRQIEQKQLKPIIENLCKRLIDSELMGGGNSIYPRWAVFDFTEVFTEIKRGKRLKKANHISGVIPYVSSTSVNNGVDQFIGNDSGVRKFKDCLTVANSGSVGCSFFHKYEFVASDHVTQLKREGIDQYAYLFLVPLVNRLAEKYSFNREINEERIKREKIILPVTEKGDIDFAFMSSFMQKVESNILKTTIDAFTKRQNVNKCERGGGKLEVISR